MDADWGAEQLAVVRVNIFASRKNRFDSLFKQIRLGNTLAFGVVKLEANECAQ